MDTIIDKELYEKTINDIFPGLTMYVRDVDLSLELADIYKPGMIIMERAFTDASNRVMGMVTSHRYAILSNHMADLSQFEHDTNWGLHTARNNAHFKVLDVYDFRGKTQILLLHLPDDNRWRLFQNVTFSIESQLIEDSRKRFEKKSMLPPVPELATPEWLERCSFPIGISDAGEVIDLEPVLQNELQSVNGENFRRFYHQFVYIECRDVLERLMGDYLTEDDTGVIAYGYIDETAGLSFQFPKLASLKDNALTLRDPKEKNLFIMRYSSLEKARYIDLSHVNIDLKQFDDFAHGIRTHYDTKNAEKEALRNLAFLDAFRHPEHPDDLAVILFHPELQPEQVWVRANYLKGHEIQGELLNEPNADFGVHQGDSIQIIPYKKDNGEIICISPQK